MKKRITRYKNPFNIKLNSAWRKNNRREIKYTWERYIAILAIIALGVGFFAGLRISKSAMVKTLDTYTIQHNMYDYRLLSTLGLTKEDRDSFLQLEEVQSAEGALTIDFIGNLENHMDIVLKAHSITNSINQLDMISGRMPVEDDECVVDGDYFSTNDIGKVITIPQSNEKDTLESFAFDEYTIVGIAKSPYYISSDRGITNLAGGTIQAFVSIPVGGFTTDYFSEIFLTLHEESKVYSKEYKSLISNNESLIDNKLSQRAELRYENIVDEANEKILEAEQEYQEGYEEYQREKTDAEAELEKAWQELLDAKKEIQQNEEKLLDGEQEIKNAEKEYKTSLKKYNHSISQFQSTKEKTLSTLTENQEELNQNRDSVTAAMKEIEKRGILEQYYQLTEMILSLENMLTQVKDPESEEYITISTQLEEAKAGIIEIESTNVLDQYTSLETALTELDAGQQELNIAKERANKEFESGEKQLKDAKAQLDDGKKEINSYKKEIKDGWKALEDGKTEYQKGLKEYEDGKKEMNNEFAKVEEELEKGRNEIKNAKDEVNDIPKPTTYIFDRSHNSGYVAFENDSSIVDSIAKVLPIFFFLVAAMVCSTTMARMVDESRTQIGTLKALGYSNGSISRKYIFYSGSAATIGCIVGYFLGIKLFPLSIWTAYGMLYNFSQIEYLFDIRLAIISLLASLLTSAGVTYLTCMNELNQMPAELIRPKAPKPGKRIFLERIPVIWNKISFLHKVSLRNIIRYKKRLFMTILGIAGCTALILAALGLKDSVSNIADDQFDTIMTYDYEIYFKEEQTKEEIENFYADNSDSLAECVFVATDTFEAMVGNKTKMFHVIATDDPNITNIIRLKSGNKDVEFPQYKKVVINDNLAKNINISNGDMITIKMSDTEYIDADVEGVFDNYVDNYMFMTGETYEAIFGEEPIYKNAYATTEKDDLNLVSTELSKNNNIAAISNVNDIRETVNNMMKSLNYIIWLVIACAGSLAFIVMYNLNNINITERTREIATIKVLGFYSFETHSYVYRENVILTILGSFVGLGLGKLLHTFVMSQVQIDIVSFKSQIFFISYFIAIAGTFILTFIVNLILKRKIDKINMTESLKSVE